MESEISSKITGTGSDKSASEEGSFDSVKAGDVDSLTGEKIKYIVYTASDFIVTIDAKMSLNWQTSNNYLSYAPDFGKIISSCELSEDLVDRLFVGKKNRFAYKKMLGSVIARILDDKNSTSADKLLAIVDERIYEHGQDRVRMAYIFYAFITVLLVGISLILAITFQQLLLNYGLGPIRYNILLCVLLGGIGAFITTFARFENYNGRLVAGLAIHRLDGFLRIFYGMIAGLIIILAIKANVLIGFANNNSFPGPMLNYFLSIVAGASEIWIPNLINQTAGGLGVNGTGKVNTGTQAENKDKNSESKGPKTENATAANVLNEAEANKKTLQEKDTEANEEKKGKGHENA